MLTRFFSEGGFKLLLLAGIFLVGLVLWISFGEEGRVDSPVDSLAALREGNRQFRNGRIDAAVELYRRGYAPEVPHSTLVYNLGTALHHRGDLAEAILWYRRGEMSGDPWLNENLLLARRALGSRQLTLSASKRIWIESTGVLRWIALLLAWLGAGLFFFDGPRRFQRWAPLAVLAAGIYTAAVWTDVNGPRAAVLLEDCVWEEQELPAGTEFWVRPDAAGWKVEEMQMTCSGDVVGLVH